MDDGSKQKLEFNQTIAQLRMAVQRLDSEFMYHTELPKFPRLNNVTILSMLNALTSGIPSIYEDLFGQIPRAKAIGLSSLLLKEVNKLINQLQSYRIEMKMTPTGQYPRNSVGHILQTLRDQGIPETVAGSVIVSQDTIMYGNQPFASFKYFPGIEQPLFRFQNEAYMRQRFIVGDDNVVKPLFRLTLSVHGTPAFEINGIDATPELHDLIRWQMLTNDTRQEGYKLSQDAAAFFQGGSEDREGQRIYIEFWKPAGAQAWVDKLNEIYRPNWGKIETLSETRDYDACWSGYDLEYIVNGINYIAKTSDEGVRGRMQGTVTVKDDEVVSFQSSTGGTWNFDPPLLPHRK